MNLGTLHPTEITRTLLATCMADAGIDGEPEDVVHHDGHVSFRIGRNRFVAPTWTSTEFHWMGLRSILRLTRGEPSWSEDGDASKGCRTIAHYGELGAVAKPSIDDWNLWARSGGSVDPGASRRARSALGPTPEILPVGRDLVVERAFLVGSSN